MNLTDRIPLRDPGVPTALRDTGCRDTKDAQSTAGCAALFIIGAAICFAVSWYLNS